MPAQPTVPAPDPPSARGILLVEQYGALGIAIAAALKKFAPLYALRVVQALSEAEPAAEPMRPELFIFDIDPAPSGEVALLNRLRRRYPNARVLVIAPGSPRELRAERGTAGAVQFLEKPFDLADFGAAVQALLGPWALPPSSIGRGTLRDLDAVDLMELKCLGRSSAVLEIEAPEGEVGEIHFQHGEICHAEAGDLTGVAAVEQIVRWSDADFSETELPKDGPRTIDQPWAALLLEVVRKMEKKSAQPFRGEALAEEPPHPQGKTILVIDDTEMLLIFAADVLAGADRNFRIVTAPSGSEGLELAAAQRPDLILLDYSLADMNGDQICRALLSNEATAQIPVLMMSGHLPEMAETAEHYGNVVETLPKPFLSGALINVVEKLLAAGPLPEAPPLPPVASKGDSRSNRTAPPASSPNGHGAAPNDNLPGAPPPNPPSAPPSPTASLLLAPPESGAVTPRWAAPPPWSAAVATELQEATATLTCEVISAELTADFRTGALHLRPAGRTVALTMGEGGNLLDLPPEVDFELEAFTLREDGKIDTVRVRPNQQAWRLSSARSEFGDENVSAESVAAGDLEPNAPDARSSLLRVQLSACFSLLRVELSPAFQLAGLILQSRSDSVRVQTSDNRAPVMQFDLHEVELDGSHLLTGLVVGAKR